MIKVYLRYSDEVFVGDVKTYNVKKVLMTCSGGIGGCSWCEYIIDFPKHMDTTAMEVTNYLGVKMILNPRYIVKVSDSQVIAVTTNNENRLSRAYGMKTTYYETPIDGDIQIYNEVKNTEQYNQGVEFLTRIDHKEELKS